MKTGSWLASVSHEVLGIFVDDGAFAITLLIWIAAAWLLLPRMEIGAERLIDWRPILFLAGLVFILAESVLRRAAETLR